MLKKAVIVASLLRCLLQCLRFRRRIFRRSSVRIRAQNGTMQCACLTTPFRQIINR